MSLGLVTRVSIIIMNIIKYYLFNVPLKHIQCVIINLIVMLIV